MGYAAGKVPGDVIAEFCIDNKTSVAAFPESSRLPAFASPYREGQELIISFIGPGFLSRGFFRGPGLRQKINPAMGGHGGASYQQKGRRGLSPRAEGHVRTGRNLDSHLRKARRKLKQKPEDSDAPCYAGAILRIFRMRDWILILAPVAATIYFLVNPDQFRELLASLTTLIQ